VDGHKLPTQYASLASSENSSTDEISQTSPVPASLIAQFFLLYYRNIIVLCRNYVSKQCVCVCVCVLGCVITVGCIRKPPPNGREPTLITMYWVLHKGLTHFMLQWSICYSKYREHYCTIESTKSEYL
jgi:hypothetical protein